MMGAGPMMTHPTIDRGTVVHARDAWTIAHSSADAGAFSMAGARVGGAGDNNRSNDGRGGNEGVDYSTGRHVRGSFLALWAIRKFGRSTRAFGSTA
jgi:hypothetical protein